MTGSSRPDLHRSITDRFIAAMTVTARDHRCPWHSGQGHRHLPRNVATGRHYRGVNILALWAEDRLRGFDAGTAGTWRDWRAAGAAILRDARSTLLVGRRRVSPARHGEQGRDLIQPCPVFLVEQTDRYTPFFGDDPPGATEIIVTCDAWLAGSGARIAFGGGGSWYDASRDTIRLRHRGSFRDTVASSQVESFYAAAFRALSHWTRAPGRSHHDLEARFGEDARIAGELTAEIFAAVACARFGVRNAPRPDLAQRIDGWHRLLRRDARALADTASMADRGLRYVDVLQQEQRDPEPLERNAEAGSADGRERFAKSDERYRYRLTTC